MSTKKKSAQKTPPKSQHGYQPTVNKLPTSAPPKTGTPKGGSSGKKK